MDHQEQKALHKKEERAHENRDDKARAKVREEQAAKGPRRIFPVWVGAVGFVLAMVSLLYWMFWL